MTQANRSANSASVASSLRMAQASLPGSSTCLVSLILLMDESGSISNENWLKQVHATADALTHPRVIDAIEGAGGIAVMARSFDHRDITRVGWHVIRNRQDAEKFAQELRNNTARVSGATDIGGAVMGSINHFPLSPCRFGKKVIDISTDGDSYNHINKLKAAREQAVRSNVIINGIAVEETVDPDGDRDSPSPMSLKSIEELLRNYLITPDGFALSANWAEYAKVIEQKLILEIASNTKKPLEIAPIILAQDEKTARSQEAAHGLPDTLPREASTSVAR